MSENRYYGYVSLTGGTSGALDSYPEDTTPVIPLITNDLAFGKDALNVFRVYRFDADSEAEADGVNVIKPVTASGRWFIVPQYNSTDPAALIIYEDGDVVYVCSATPGSVASDAVWQIKKIDSTSGVIITWADGNSNYDNVATSLNVVKNLSYS